MRIAAFLSVAMLMASTEAVSQAPRASERTDRAFDVFEEACIQTATTFEGATEVARKRGFAGRRNGQLFAMIEMETGLALVVKDARIVNGELWAPTCSVMISSADFNSVAEFVRSNSTSFSDARGRLTEVSNHSHPDGHIIREFLTESGVTVYLGVINAADLGAVGLLLSSQPLK